MMTAVSKEKMSVSKATSTLIGLILHMSPKEIMETLEYVEHKTNKLSETQWPNMMAEVVFAVDKRFCKGMARSIEAHGIFIQTAEQFCAGESITLSFENRVEGRQIKATGKIMTVTDEGIDVVFDTHSEKEAC